MLEKSELTRKLEGWMIEVSPETGPPANEQSHHMAHWLMVTAYYLETEHGQTCAARALLARAREILPEAE